MSSRASELEARRIRLMLRKLPGLATFSEASQSSFRDLFLPFNCPTSGIVYSIKVGKLDQSGKIIKTITTYPSILPAPPFLLVRNIIHTRAVLHADILSRSIL